MTDSHGGRFALLALLAFGAGSMAAPVPRELKVRPDGERMQGVWAFDGYDNGGPQNTGARWLIDEGKLYIGGQNTTDNKGSPFDFVVRAKASPPEIDFDAGPRHIWRGIYKFVGEELHLAYVMDADRPKNFTSVHGKFIMVMKRVSEAKE